jgi:hypothetical protein
MIPSAPALISFGIRSLTTFESTTVSTDVHVDLYRCATVGALRLGEAYNTFKLFFRYIHLDPPSFRPNAPLSRSII